MHTLIPCSPPEKKKVEKQEAAKRNPHSPSYMQATTASTQRTLPTNRTSTAHSCLLSKPTTAPQAAHSPQRAALEPKPRQVQSTASAPNATEVHPRAPQVQGKAPDATSAQKTGKPLDKEFQRISGPLAEKGFPSKPGKSPKELTLEERAREAHTGKGHSTAEGPLSLDKAPSDPLCYPCSLTHPPPPHYPLNASKPSQGTETREVQGAGEAPGTQADTAETLRAPTAEQQEGWDTAAVTAALQKMAERSHTQTASKTATTGNQLALPQAAELPGVKATARAQKENADPKNFAEALQNVALRRKQGLAPTEELGHSQAVTLVVEEEPVEKGTKHRRNLFEESTSPNSRKSKKWRPKSPPRVRSAISPATKRGRTPQPRKRLREKEEKAPDTPTTAEPTTKRLGEHRGEELNSSSEIATQTPPLGDIVDETQYEYPHLEESFTGEKPGTPLEEAQQTRAPTQAPSKVAVPEEEGALATEPPTENRVEHLSPIKGRSTMEETLSESSEGEPRLSPTATKTKAREEQVLRAKATTAEEAAEESSEEEQRFSVTAAKARAKKIEGNTSATVDSGPMLATADTVGGEPTVKHSATANKVSTAPAKMLILGKKRGSQVRCLTCGDIRSHSAFAEHTRKQHPELAEQHDINNPRTQMNCNLCGKTFEKATSRMNHRNICAAQRGMHMCVSEEPGAPEWNTPEECKYCKGKFATKDSLKHHIAKLHRHEEAAARGAIPLRTPQREMWTMEDHAIMWEANRSGIITLSELTLILKVDRNRVDGHKRTIATATRKGLKVHLIHNGKVRPVSPMLEDEQGREMRKQARATILKRLDRIVGISRDSKTIIANCFKRLETLAEQHRQATAQETANQAPKQAAPQQQETATTRGAAAEEETTAMSMDITMDMAPAPAPVRKTGQEPHIAVTAEAPRVPETPKAPKMPETQKVPKEQRAPEAQKEPTAKKALERQKGQKAPMVPRVSELQKPPEVQKEPGTKKAPEAPKRPRAQEEPKEQEKPTAEKAQEVPKAPTEVTGEGKPTTRVTTGEEVLVEEEEEEEAVAREAAAKTATTTVRQRIPAKKLTAKQWTELKMEYSRIPELDLTDEMTDEQMDKEINRWTDALYMAANKVTQTKNWSEAKKAQRTEAKAHRAPQRTGTEARVALKHLNEYKELREKADSIKADTTKSKEEWMEVAQVAMDKRHLIAKAWPNAPELPAPSKEEDWRPAVLKARNTMRHHLSREKQKATKTTARLEKRRLIEFYEKDRVACVDHILGTHGKRQQCNIPTATLEEHFARENEGSKPAPAATEAWKWQPAAPKAEKPVEPIKEGEVKVIFQRLAKGKAPGPDGIPYEVYTKLGTAKALAMAFEQCRRRAHMPATWKESVTVLIYKKGDESIPTNWRPLALGQSVAKMYATLLSMRLRGVTEASKLLSRPQKGFRPISGCMEHIAVLRMAMENAKRHQQSIYMIFFDLRNAFGSVSHGLIHKALEETNVPLYLRDIVKDMYTATTTTVAAESGTTRPIGINTGVRQGCPLSPQLFNFCIDALLTRLEGEQGYEMVGIEGHRPTVNAMAYADDIVTVADSLEGAKRQLRAVEEFAEWTGLKFGIAKCGLIAHTVENRKVVHRPIELTLQGEVIPQLKGDETYRYLGIMAGFDPAETKKQAEAVSTKVLGEIKKIAESQLTPWQKLDAIRTFGLPKFDYLCMNAEPSVGWARKLDNDVRMLVKKALGLPMCTSSGIFGMRLRDGGLGIRQATDRILTGPLNTFVHLASSKDSALKEVLTHAVKDAEREHHPIKDERGTNFCGWTYDERGKLAHEGERRGKRVHTWLLRVAEACNKLGQTIQLKEDGSLQGDWASINERASETQSKAHKTEWSQALCQGRAVEHFTMERASFTWMRNGMGLSEDQWKFALKARLDVLPTRANLQRWGIVEDATCQRCHKGKETIAHVLCHCPCNEAEMVARHNRVANRLVKEAEEQGDVVSIQPAFPASSLGGILRPDLLATDGQGVRVCEVSVVAERDQDMTLQARREKKINKYTPRLAKASEETGTEYTLAPVTVGALGGLDHSLKEDLETWLPGIEKERRHLQRIANYVTVDAIRGSHLCWVSRCVDRRQTEGTGHVNHNAEA